MSVNFIMKYLAAAEKAKNYRNKLDGKNACRGKKGFRVAFSIYFALFTLPLFVP